VIVLRGHHPARHHYRLTCPRCGVVVERCCDRCGATSHVTFAGPTPCRACTAKLRILFSAVKSPLVGRSSGSRRRALNEATTVGRRVRRAAAKYAE
jgi:hypothetical protein